MLIVKKGKPTFRKQTTIAGAFHRHAKNRIDVRFLQSPFLKQWPIFVHFENLLMFTQQTTFTVIIYHIRIMKSPQEINTQKYPIRRFSCTRNTSRHVT